MRIIFTVLFLILTIFIIRIYSYQNNGVGSSNFIIRKNGKTLANINYNINDSKYLIRKLIKFKILFVKQELMKKVINFKSSDEITENRKTNHPFKWG
jgi:hypothetical protein